MPYNEGPIRYGTAADDGVRRKPFAYDRSELGGARLQHAIAPPEDAGREHRVSWLNSPLHLLIPSQSLLRNTLPGKADEPAKHQVVLYLLNQLTLGSNREHDHNQAGPDQPLGRDRGAAEIGIERSKNTVEVGEGVIGNLPDLAHRMSGGNTILKIDVEYPSGLGALTG